MAALTNDQILDAIANMTVLEASELVKAMEEKFGVTAAAPVAVAAAGAAGAGALRGARAAVAGEVHRAPPPGRPRPRPGDPRRGLRRAGGGALQDRPPPPSVKHEFVFSGLDLCTFHGFCPGMPPITGFVR